MAIKVHAVTTGPVAELATRNAVVKAEIVLSGDPRARSRPGGSGTSVVVEAQIVWLEFRDGLALRARPSVMVTDAVAARNAPEADVSEVGVRGAVGVDSPVVVTDVGAARKAPKADVSEVGVRGGAGADS
ncbi:hypothetical protein, partial [Acrocarpospora pleiomorpha]|uniref:hypothetical protein n=1 Tax=Acrocarpospora pleiomorpha TaxID=90975 RepID=UPI001C3FA7E5